MDVQCERCKAEYEFDDALVSGRGTTVKCTSCGHQFKIRRAVADKPDAAPDRWVVKTTEGRELVFTTLRELQKAILAKQVGRADSLTRGEASSRALGAISELEPFFDEAAEKSTSGARPAPGPPNAKTLVGSSVASQSRIPSRPPPPLAGHAAPALRPIPTPTPPPASHLSHMSNDQMRPRIDTIRPPSTAPAVPPPSHRPRPPGSSASDDSGAGPAPAPGASVSVAPVISAGNLAVVPAPMSLPIASSTSRTEHTPPMPVAVHMSEPPPLPLRARASQGPPPAQRIIASSPPAASNRPPPPTIHPWPETSSGLPPPTVPVRRQDGYRSAMESEEVGEISVPGAPRRLGGWIVALVLIGGVGLVGFGVAKPYLNAQSALTASSATALDPRAQKLLSDGERAMASGDLDSANDDFVKASALAEKDPHLLIDVARLANARADVPWLRAKLLPSEASDDVKANKAQLDDLAGRARRAADDAAAANADPTSATLARIDSLRVSGDSVGARALVSRVPQNGSQPETAYVLAALDLDETEPLWPMILERLRIAAASEGEAGRARAALVYALARSGDAPGAKGELEKLAGSARPYPLVGALRAFIAKSVAGAKDAGAPAGPAGMAATATVDVSALPHAAHGARGGGGGGFTGATDSRLLLQQAESAKAAHDWDRARALYSSALAQNGSDSEALAGLGDCDHAGHDLASAASYYKRALSANPVYLPALVGLADVEWETGDKDEAQKTYHDITDRFPEGTYPPRVKTRANDSTGGALVRPATGSSSEAAPAAAAPSSDPTGSP